MRATSRGSCDQHHVAGLDRHVGAGPDGDADVGRQQRRRVVDAVAHHGTRLPCACSSLILSALSSGSTSANTCRSRVRGHAVGHAFESPVSMATSMPSSCSRSPLHGIPAGSRRRRQTPQGRDRPRSDRWPPGRSWPKRRRPRAGPRAAWRPSLRSSAGPPTFSWRPSTSASTPWPAMAWNPSACGTSRPRSWALFRGLGRSGARSRAPPRRRGAARIVLLHAVGGDRLDHAVLAEGQRARLVEHDDVQVARFLQPPPVADQQAVAGAHRGGDGDDQRHRQPQRMGQAITSTVTMRVMVKSSVAPSASHARRSARRLRAPRA
jgi:hypothetical protein